MKKELVSKPEIKLVGLSVRINNQKATDDPEISKIEQLVGQYGIQNIASQITHRKNPEVTIAVYTEYDLSKPGEYTYFIGEEVNSFENIPANLQALTIASANYQKFTTLAGKMPEIVINAWQQIWKMSPNDFGGERAFIADFEVYDHRASDPANTSLDIYIGLK